MCVVRNLSALCSRWNLDPSSVLCLMRSPDVMPSSLDMYGAGSPQKAWGFGGGGARQALAHFWNYENKSGQMVSSKKLVSL